MRYLTPAADGRAAEWVRRGVNGFGESVRSLVPAGFAVYVRVFHPAYRKDVPVRWQTIAAALNRVSHPEMQFTALVDDKQSRNDARTIVFDAPPERGSLPLELIAPLAAVLSGHTTSDSCNFAAWEGFGALDAEVALAPTFDLPGRRYHLLRGTTPEGATENVVYPPARQSPNLWWPDDHAWCVATEIDLDSTYIGCDEPCANELLALPQIEGHPINSSAGIAYNTDAVNRPR
jgi:hypothetical protein